MEPHGTLARDWSLSDRLFGFAVAAAADTVVLAVGTDLTWAAEGHDATSISFTDAQLQLIEQTAAAA